MSSQISGFYQKTRETVVSNYNRAFNTYEHYRSTCVNSVGRVLPSSRNIADRISRAVPAVFCALSALTGIWTMPACLYSVGRTVWSLSPLLKSVARFDSSSKVFTKALTGASMKALFDNLLVPALLVYFAAQSVLTLPVGLLTLNWAKLLYASAIALPATWLAYDRLRHLTPIPAEPKVLAAPVSK